MSYRLTKEEEQLLATSPQISSLKNIVSYRLQHNQQYTKQQQQQQPMDLDSPSRYESSSIHSHGNGDSDGSSRSLLPRFFAPIGSSHNGGSALLAPMSLQSPTTSSSSLTGYVNTSVSNFFASQSQRAVPTPHATATYVPLQSKPRRNSQQGSTEGIGLLRSSSSSSLSLKQFVPAPKAKPKTAFVCVDEDLLYRAVKDAGRWALGCVMVETWVQIGDQIHLPLGGCWIDPVFHNCDHSHDCHVCRLLNPLNPKYVPPAPLAPGEGLQGYMWSHSEEMSSTRPTSLFFRSIGGGDANHHLVWRDIKTIANDPHQPYNPRLRALAECGVGWAAAVPFLVDGQKGMVVYITRENVDMEHLQGNNNESYLFCAAQLVGSAWALRSPRRKAKKEIRRTVDNAMRRVRIKILAYRRMGIDLSNLTSKTATTRPVTLSAVSMVHGYDDFQDEDPSFSLTEFWHSLRDKTKTVAKKCLGQNVPPPPPVSMSETWFSCMSVLVSLTILTTFNVFMVSAFGTAFEVPLGPFGALMGLQFCLTAAPAAQPLNAIMGQAISAFVGLVVADLYFLETWMRQAFATTIAIGIMSSLGIVHPPASASAIIFASGGVSWTNALSLMIANMLAVIVATLANNLNNRRQYPTTWGFRYFASMLELRKKEKGEMSPQLFRKLRGRLRKVLWTSNKRQNNTPRSARKDSIGSDYGSVSNTTTRSMSFSSMGDLGRLSPV